MMNIVTFCDSERNEKETFDYVQYCGISRRRDKINRNSYALHLCPQPYVACLEKEGRRMRMGEVCLKTSFGSYRPGRRRLGSFLAIAPGKV